MHILGFETSCDETAAAIVSSGHQVRANIISSQVQQHAEYGGVIPELAAREHLRSLTPVVERACSESELPLSSLSAIAVTYSPGLLPALLVGLSYAKGLAASLDLPLIGVNHFMAHIFGAFIDHQDVLCDPKSYPIVALVVSGGHTALTMIEEDGSCRLLGQTLDDAAGEAFDKAAKIMNLGYPGGPVIDRLAKSGDCTSHQFPRGLIGSGGTPLKPENRYNFSFSGVKTSLLYHCRELPPLPTSGDDIVLPQVWLDTVASYQEAIVDVLVKKLLWAAGDHGAPTLVLCGGVACNGRLRERAALAADESGHRLLIAPPKYCTDNAAMIAGLAYYLYESGQTHPLTLDASPRLDRFTNVPFTPAT